MTTNPPLFTDLELKARQTIRDARMTDWSPCQQRILNVFQAMWGSSLPTAQITAVADAMQNGPAGLSLQPFLTKLVRRKVLRSRSIKGVTHYELNI